jgi:thiosulfate/3-mercaptopyruvate sulfurtransferase
MKTTLIDAAQLNGLAGSAGLLVVDCRFDLADPSRGEADYASGHIAGAVHADLDRDLADLSKRGLGRHPLPDDAAFSSVLGSWGWTPQTMVVAYDTANGALAASRLWWMLRLVGQRNVAVLDGGLTAWKSAGLALTADRNPVRQTSVNVRFDRNQIVDSEQLTRAGDDVLLLDARAAPRFRGEVEPIDKVAGHIPGARNRAFSENLAPDGQFKPADVLRHEFDALMGSRTAPEVVHMCGSGVTACHNLLAMEHAGLPGSRVYVASWSGWIADPSRPVALGAG